DEHRQEPKLEHVLRSHDDPPCVVGELFAGFLCSAKRDVPALHLCRTDTGFLTWAATSVSLMADGRRQRRGEDARRDDAGRGIDD
ncbi:MAG: hypothetical protein L6Q38_11740, partial [Nitrospira sp.]|nr:hypothetical protein [Nitrospira sp.]